MRRLEPERRRLEGRGHRPRGGRRSRDPGSRRALADREGRGPAAAGRPRASPDPQIHSTSTPDSPRRLRDHDPSQLIDGTWEDGDRPRRDQPCRRASSAGWRGADAKTASARPTLPRGLRRWSDLPPGGGPTSCSRPPADRRAGRHHRRHCWPARPASACPRRSARWPSARSTSAGSRSRPAGRSGEVIPHEAADRRHLSLRRPVGVVASLTPVELPLLDPGPQAGARPRRRVHRRRPGLREGTAGGDRDGPRDRRRRACPPASSTSCTDRRARSRRPCSTTRRSGP